MTTATATADSKSVGTKEKARTSSPAIKKKSTTGPTLRRLLEYMAGGEARGKFVGGILVRVVALLGLTAMPFVIGQGTNVISEPDGTTAELVRWAILGVIAGAGLPGGELFCRPDILRPGNKGTQQAPDRICSPPCRPFLWAFSTGRLWARS